MAESNSFWFKDEAPDGVYILTESMKCVVPKYWCLHETEEVQGVAIIGKHSLVIAKDGVRDLLPLIESNKLQKNRQFATIEGIDYIEGSVDTLLLADIKSEAATACLNYSCGTIVKGKWHLPSISELALMYDHKKDVDLALAICGGSAVDTDRRILSSTRKSGKENWNLSWSDGHKSYGYQVFLYRIRPVALL